jgi:hypothetical protein
MILPPSVGAVLDCIQSIILNRAEVKMIGSDTELVIASMQHPRFARNATVLEDPGLAMGSNGPAFQRPVLTIATVTYRPLPNPAIGCLLNPLPKAGLMASMHESGVTRTGAEFDLSSRDACLTSVERASTLLANEFGLGNRPCMVAGERAEFRGGCSPRDNPELLTALLASPLDLVRLASHWRPHSLVPRAWRLVNVQAHFSR